jgi:hypothetical protein
MTTLSPGRVRRLFGLALPAAALIAGACPSAAQTPAAQTPRPDTRATDLQNLRREMDEMRRRYEDQVQTLKRDYEDRLSALERRLDTAEKTAPAPTPPAPTPPTAAPAAAAARAPTPAPTPTPAASTQSASAFNPAIGVILDGTYARYGRNRQNGATLPGFMVGDDAGLPRRGFGVNESELTLSANVDQALYGAVTAAISPNETIALEEAFIQSTSLPWGFTLKGGRFFSGIGYLNEFHAHAWDFVDQPLPYKAFLNNQLGDDGVQIRWVAPTNVFVELGAEGLRGDKFPAAGAGNGGAGQYAVFAHVGDDIGEESSYRVGFSYLRSEARDRTTGPGDLFAGTSDLKIVDAVFKWAPDGNPAQRNLKLQGEFFWRDDRGAFNASPYKGTAYGWYLQGVYQFMPRWRTGYRYDQLKAAAIDPSFLGTTLDSFGRSGFRNSAMLEYSTSEFGRFRLNLIRDDTMAKPDDQILLQYTVSLGSHGAHKF